FMSSGDSSMAFTESLLHTIRLYRHYGTRVIIATQEPTIDSRLLDLCTITIVHRFTSPEWMQVLKAHLAGASASGGAESEQRANEIYQAIVQLGVGQALLFSPLALLDVGPSGPQQLGVGHVKMRIRQRLTTDGGKSKLAT
ncbi:MAG: hypothetical protein Q9183_008038, partial [Haloplaca sp. 2 TL-2023]